MPRTVLTLLLLPLFLACKTESNSIEKKEYPGMVGDIVEDSQLDDRDFKACDSLERAAQYFHKKKSFAYKGEKAAVLEIFEKGFKPIENKNQNGWVRIRFMVNCQGKTGRFRLIQSNFAYGEFEFDKRITDQLMTLTKNLDGWEVASNAEFAYDYYQYLIFKIEAGQLTEILP